MDALNVVPFTGCRIERLPSADRPCDTEAPSILDAPFALNAALAKAKDDRIDQLLDEAGSYRGMIRGLIAALRYSKTIHSHHAATDLESRLAVEELDRNIKAAEKLLAEYTGA